jgi:hypothetical protein
MASQIKAFFARFFPAVRAVLVSSYHYLLLAYHYVLQAASTAAVRIGAIVLVAGFPLIEIAVGLDLVSTVAVIAPGLAIFVAVVLAAVYFYRRFRRTDGGGQD